MNDSVIQDRKAGESASPSAGATGDSFAFQNKGGIVLALLGALVGLLKKNPLMTFVGLAAGFVMGSLTVDRDRGLLGGLIGGRREQAQHTPQIEDPQEAKDSVQVAATSPVVRDSDPHDVTFDQDFSRGNRMLATAQPPVRTQKHYR